jgi:2'-5' RNA ligase
MTSEGTVAGDDQVRLFLALEVPEDVASELGRWGRAELSGGRRPDSFHVTLAFLGSRPRSALAGILGVLRREAAATEAFVLEPVGYRETRSVGMLVLADPSGLATSLAERVQRGLETLELYEREQRRWLPHVTVLRFRQRPRLAPLPPDIGAFAPSGAAAFLSRLHPSGARYEVLESCSLGSTRLGVTERGLEQGG